MISVSCFRSKYVLGWLSFHCLFCWETSGRSVYKTRQCNPILRTASTRSEAAWTFLPVSVERYADALAQHAEKSLDTIWGEALQILNSTAATLHSSLNQSEFVYQTFLQEFSQQQQRLQKLAMLEMEISLKPTKLSLEKFRRHYDKVQSLFDEVFPEMEPHKRMKKKRRGTKSDTAEEIFLKKGLSMTQEGRELLDQRIDETFTKFGQESGRIMSDLEHQIKRSKKLYLEARENLQRQKLKAEVGIKQFQEEQISLLRNNKPFQKVASMTKKELNARQEVIKKRLDNLQDQLSKFSAPFEEAQKQLENELRERYQQLHLSRQLYEELLVRKRNKIYVENLVDRTLRKVLQCLDEGLEEKWELVSNKSNIIVARKFLASDDLRGSKYVCVKAIGQLSVSPDQVKALFANSSRAVEYNPYLGEGRDLETIDVSTTVVWASSPGVFVFKPRDFCTLVHFRELEDGSQVVISRCVDHPKAPLTHQYQRARMLLGAQIISPVPNDSNKCKFITVTQVDPGGFAPAWIINQMSAIGPIMFMKNIEKAAQKT